MMQYCGLSRVGVDDYQQRCLGCFWNVSGLELEVTSMSCRIYGELASLSQAETATLI